MTGLVVSIAMTALGKLQTQKLGLSVGLAIGVGLTLAVLATIVLLSADNEEKTNTPARPAARGHVIYTVRWGDVVRGSGHPKSLLHAHGPRSLRSGLLG
jgi:hypothetical protein